ncbi:MULTISPECIES: V-type ATP synthase subunit I [unclassified Methanoregula]|uniref:V-type ATP synthase subunit I n=1 Tax=unclassified Methanoregula TaxID=2649730 RepID=UPI0009CA429D|nr:MULTISPECIES: V-type ATP synthase subunit I [unclassified Methanoregula]OPX64201.1 MAG: V-type ATP synthase subunit I [Methanoregula sp. PtaB.Bin085]OPY33675.1 MAG: V-type ATP synthase subunit I [Methanoregula sp. PtaU1.Bin006]
MLKPKQMSRLLIAASRDQMAPVIAELYRHNLFHIEEYVDVGAEGYEGFKIGTPLSGASEKSADLIKIRAITNAISLSADDVEKGPSCSMDELQARIERELPLLEREVEELTVRRSKLDAREKELEQKIHELTPFSDIPVDLNLYHGYKRFTTIAGYVSRDFVLSVPHEKYLSQGKEKRFLVMVYPSDRKSEVEKTLQEAGFQSVPVPNESGSARGRIEFYQGEITATRKEILEISTQLEDVKKKHAGFLVACEELLKAEVDQSEAPLRFATTKQTFVAEGWVPADKVRDVTNSLTHVTEGKIFITVVPIDPEQDSVPVEYDNPDFARPTQVLMDVYSRPRYTEVDPTLMVSIVFPIFFGLIVGDVGYGLIFLAMAFGLRKFLKGEAGGQMLAVLRNASISTIIFGFIYSEFLGFAIPGWKPLLYSRHLMAEEGGHGPNIPELMVLSIWIGIVHLTLGRILGMYNHATQDHGHHRTLAVMANFGWLAVMWGIILAIWSSAAIPLMPDLRGLPVLWTVPGLGFGVTIGHVVGIVLLLVGIICIARENFLEVIELPTIVSHVLSYARLVAVGLSGVAIAMVVNYMTFDMFINPALANFTILSIIGILAGIVVFVFGHLLNIALSILGGGLHSIRLHYVEFFTKFYKGGGIRYNPFGIKRRFTEE